MSVIILLIITSLIVAMGFLVAFFWAVGNGQFEDDYTPSVRILFDNEMVFKNDEKDIIAGQNESKTSENKTV